MSSPFARVPAPLLSDRRRVELMFPGALFAYLAELWLSDFERMDQKARAALAMAQQQELAAEIRIAEMEILRISAAAKRARAALAGFYTAVAEPVADLASDRRVKLIGRARALRRRVCGFLDRPEPPQALSPVALAAATSWINARLEAGELDLEPSSAFAQAFEIFTDHVEEREANAQALAGALDRAAQASRLIHDRLRAEGYYP